MSIAAEPFVKEKVVDRRDELQSKLNNVELKLNEAGCKLSAYEQSLRSIRHCGVGGSVESSILVRELVSTSQCCMNCVSCKQTCDDPCNRVLSNYFCRSFDISGNCRFCVGKCDSSSHIRQMLKWEVKLVTKEETYTNILEQHNIYPDDTDGITKLSQHFQNAIKEARSNVFSLVDEAVSIYDELNPSKSGISRVTYLDILGKKIRDSVEIMKEQKLETLKRVREEIAPSQCQNETQSKVASFIANYKT